MPTYDYQCDYCDHKFEEIQKMSDEPLKICPECGMDALVRLIGGGVGIIFKGDGWTDSTSVKQDMKRTSKEVKRE